MEWIYKKIWELKSKALTSENKARIQKLQQLLDGETQSLSASEKVDKNNSANKDSSTEEQKDIDSFLFNRYNRQDSKGMRRQLTELMFRIKNLKDLLQHTIRIGEKDLSREVRRQIEIRERELIILKVQMNKENEKVS